MLALAVFETSFREENLLWDRRASRPENINREGFERRHGIGTQSNRLELSQGPGKVAYLDLSNGRLSIPIQEKQSVVQAFAGSWPHQAESAQFLRGTDEASHQVRASVLFELERLFNSTGKIELVTLFEKPAPIRESYSGQDRLASQDQLAVEQALFTAHRNDYLARVKAAQKGLKRVVMVDDFRIKYEQKDEWGMSLYRGWPLELLYGAELSRAFVQAKNTASL